LKQAEQVSGPVTLHLDLTDPVKEDYSFVMFELAFFGGVFSNSDLFLWSTLNTTLCIELACGSLYERLHSLRSLQCVEVEATASSFAASESLLRIGMGAEYFSTRNDGTMKFGSKAGSTAYQRLQYVCAALALVKSGSFPHHFEPPSSCNSNESDEDAVMGAVPDVPAPECFDLLCNASSLIESPSLWCVWNFINVFYWQLRDMHHPESPINCACMPDISSQSARDAESKSKLKCEVVQFLIRTAREFATRQVKNSFKNRITACRIRGFSRPEFNGLWRRMGFDNDGFPCFQTGTFFLYFRAAQNQWVIDDVIEPTGGCYSKSRTSDYTKPWCTLRAWEDNNSLRVRQVRADGGYRNEGVTVAGVRDLEGASVGLDEVGTYVRETPDNDIAGRAHYIKHKGERRHLFWKPSENAWQISPVCNDDEGAYALSSTHNIEGVWKSIPASLVEQQFTFEMLTQQELEDRENPNRGADAEQQEEKLKGVLSGAEIQETLLKWNDSNHECLLFSNESHVVHFLSLDAKIMKNKMHPGLLRHLLQNNINVGADLESLSSNHELILGALTDIKRTKLEAASIMGGTYCLTGP
jgi:hypothetical protein